MTIQEILGDNEFNLALDTDKPILIDFMASWCAPCKLQTPILREFYQELQDKVVVYKLDVDQNPQLAARYKIDSIPTIILFLGGEIKAKSVGLTTKAQLADMLIKHL